VLEFREDLLDRVQVWRVFRQEEELGTMCCKRTMPSVEYEKDAGESPGDGFAKCEGVAARG
jgi:hypothetical protein